LRDGAAHHGLAGAGFPDQPEDPAAREGEVEIADHRDGLGPDAGGDRE
jgi:hypothetical protein